MDAKIGGLKYGEMRFFYIMLKYLPRRHLLMAKRKSIKVTEDKGKLRNCPRLKRLKRQLNTLCDTRLLHPSPGEVSH